MKKTIALLLSLLLALGAVTAFSGCTKEEATDRKTEASPVSLIGTWEGSLPMGDALSGALAGEESADQDPVTTALLNKMSSLDYSSLMLPVNMTFDEDTVTLSFPEEAAETFKADLIALMREPIQEVLEEELNKQLPGMTLEDAGIDLDELLAEMADSMDFDSIAEDSTDPYVLEGSTLYFGEDRDEIFEIDLSADKFVIKSATLADTSAADETTQMVAKMFENAVFNKVG